jgi:hypothetical protein
MSDDHTAANHRSDPDPYPGPREQELLWPFREHPDDLVLFDLHATRFPGTWVGIVENSIPYDQRNALRVCGYSLFRIELLPGAKAQVVVRENARPDRDGDIDHEPTNERYEQYDPRKRGESSV